MTTETARTFSIESIELRELCHLDLRHEAVQAQWVTRDESVSREDEDEILASLSTQEPFAQHSALAYRVVFIGVDGLYQARPAEALVVTRAGRIGIAWGADATWGDLRDACDLTTETTGQSFADALNAAVNDWANDAEAWEARA